MTDTGHDSSFQVSHDDHSAPWDGIYTEEEFVGFCREMLGELARFCDDDGRHEFDTLWGQSSIANFIRHQRIGWILRHEPSEGEPDFGSEPIDAADIATEAFANLFADGELEWAPHREQIHLRVTNYARASQYTVDAAESSVAAKMADLRTLNEMPYRQYLDSSVWKERRERHLEFAGDRCQICNRSGRLNVHHRTYARRGYERAADLVVLCADCHQLFHQSGRIN